MNKKKLIAAAICLVLVITAALPGTLAVSADAASSDGTISVATPETAQTPDEAAPQSETEQPAEPETPVEAKTCTCDPAPAEGEAHKEGCPLYAAPEQPSEEPKTEPEAETKTCTCDPAPADGEEHKEGCPLYVAPFVHLEGCADDCTAEDCKCTCHLMKKIMECTTLDEIWEVLEAASEEAFEALTDEQNKKIDARIEELEPVPAPAVTLKAADSIVESEIFVPTANYTNVAPFGEPVGRGQ